MNDTKIQWHPGFYSAMELELAQNKEILEFHKEVPLNMKPILIDLLVIRKKADITLENEIGKFFRGHNIMEYKSPDDEMGIDVYYKAYAYACLYKSNGTIENSIDADDITVTLVREAKPITLLNFLKSRGFQIERKYPGIYHVHKSGIFPTQIVVTKDLDKDLHIWLRALTAKLDKASAEKLIDKIHTLTKKDERENADSVLKVTIDANNSLFQLLRRDGDNVMSCDSLLRLMKPELDAAEAQGVARGITQGMAQGMTQGEDMLSRLIQALILNNRTDDINLVTKDEKARKEMYRKYGIIK